MASRHAFGSQANRQGQPHEPPRRREVVPLPYHRDRLSSGAESESSLAGLSAVAPEPIAQSFIGHNHRAGATRAHAVLVASLVIIGLAVVGMTTGRVAHAIDAAAAVFTAPAFSAPATVLTAQVAAAPAEPFADPDAFAVAAVSGPEGGVAFEVKGLSAGTVFTWSAVDDEGRHAAGMGVASGPLHTVSAPTATVGAGGSVLIEVVHPRTGRLFEASAPRR